MYKYIFWKDFIVKNRINEKHTEHTQQQTQAHSSSRRERVIIIIIIINSLTDFTTTITRVQYI